MSRIGRMPIDIPAGVTVAVAGNTVEVKGPKGALTQVVDSRISVAVEGNVVNVTRSDDQNESRSMHGLYRTLISNMITGVTKGFSKELEINGVGYRAAKEGNQLVLTVGFSHLVYIKERGETKIDVPGPNKVVVSGPDKQAVGQLAAEIREVRPPEPYLGKGIKYSTEVIRRKEGKTAAKKK
ncbi:MAG: 50S ribosomal protein L6 [Clostridia bacterium]|nr:50S ribosomal protein L6 [Clostridia bacterium]